MSNTCTSPNSSPIASRCHSSASPRANRTASVRLSSVAAAATAISTHRREKRSATVPATEPEEHERDQPHRQRRADRDRVAAEPEREPCR